MFTTRWNGTAPHQAGFDNLREKRNEWGVGWGASYVLGTIDESVLIVSESSCLNKTKQLIVVVLYHKLQICTQTTADKKKCN